MQLFQILETVTSDTPNLRRREESIEVMKTKIPVEPVNENIFAIMQKKELQRQETVRLPLHLLKTVGMHTYSRYITRKSGWEVASVLHFSIHWRRGKRGRKASSHPLLRMRSRLYASHMHTRAHSLTDVNKCEYTVTVCQSLQPTIPQMHSVVLSYSKTSIYNYLLKQPYVLGREVVSFRLNVASIKDHAIMVPNHTKTSQLPCLMESLVVG